MEVITNNHPRDLLRYDELSEKDQIWFNFPGADECDYVRYKGMAYCVSDFMRTTFTSDEFKGWDGYEADTFFSGVLVKFVRESMGEQVIMGRYFT